MLLISFVLIALGLVFLLKNLGLISVESWSVIWPSLIVVLGIYLGFVAHRFHKFIDRVWKFINKAEDKLLHPFDK